MFVPGANVVFMTLAAHSLGIKLGKKDSFVLLYVFIPFVWFIITGSQKQTVKINSPTEPQVADPQTSDNTNQVVS